MGSSLWDNELSMSERAQTPIARVYLAGQKMQAISLYVVPKYYP